MNFSVRLLAICLLATACSQTDSTAPEFLEATLLLYEEQEAGTDSYPVRVLVTQDYVRMDDGFATSDYVLFDRHSRSVFSIVHEERSILVIDHHPGDATLPADIEPDIVRDTDTAAPTIGARQPVHMQFIANGVVCLEAVVVPGLLADTAGALAEYAVALGDRQLSAMASVPEDMRTPCFLLRYAYLPGQHFREGLPVREWDARGYRRSLGDFREDERVAAGLFTLPSGYSQIRLR